MNSHAPAGGRIAVLSPLVIDQIAAGEVVERPASVVKELVDNSLDAGATRIDVELEDGGLARISVRDNGRGIHPDDLPLAVTRHATSKLRDTSDLNDIRTLGFRGEALASVAAVARIDIRSRQASAAVGTHLHGIPGEPHLITPAGMPVGTQIDVHALFANVPARRKFMRAEATEVGQVSETLLRLAIVHPDVHFTLRHGKRELLNLPRTDLAGRVAQVLERRVAGPFFAFAGEDDGIRVEAFLPHPSAVARGRGSPYLITRKRVVRERSLGQILAQAYGIAGEAPSACLIVEPPAGAVDVNVHPQKTEVRFSDPQQVYAAVRRVLAAAMAAAPWASELAARAGDAGLMGHVQADIPARAAADAAGHAPGDMSSRPPGPAELAPGDGAPTALPVGRAGRSGRATPGPAAARVERTAAAAAAERRASADAWLARAEAAVDRAEPLHEVSAPPPTPRPSVVPAAPPAADDWDLDLAGSAAAGTDLSREPAPSDRAPDPSEATGEAPAGPAPRPAAGQPVAPASRAPDDLSPEPAARRSPTDTDLPPNPAEQASAWLARAGATVDDDQLASARPREQAAAWLERAGADVPRDLGETPLLRWSEQQPEHAPEDSPSAPAPEDRPAAASGYRLSTRALGPDYDRHKRAVMEAAAALRPADAAAPPRPAEPARASAPEAPVLFDPGPRQPDAPEPRDMRETTGPIGQPARVDPPALLACLPGPVAIFADRDALLAVDLRRVRSHLVYLRLQRDLLGRRAVAVQGLLTPAVVRRGAADVALLTAARAELLTLGVDLEAFGDDAVVVRGVPAHLRHCVDDADAADLVARIVPWLRIRAGDGDRAARERGLLDAIATTRGGDPAPRLARRWLAELLEAGGSLESVPGIRRWNATALLGGA